MRFLVKRRKEDFDVSVPLHNCAVAGAALTHPLHGANGHKYGQARPQSISRAAGDAMLASMSGRRRAVTIGIKYSDIFISLLTNQFRFDVSTIRQLRDDHPQRMPTRKNIVAALSWFVSGACA